MHNAFKLEASVLSGMSSEEAESTIDVWARDIVSQGIGREVAAWLLKLEFAAARRRVKLQQALGHQPSSRPRIG
jgi:hypothetical protein